MEGRVDIVRDGWRRNKTRIGGTRAHGRSIFRSLPHTRLLSDPTHGCASPPPYPPAIHLLFLCRHNPLVAFPTATAFTHDTHASTQKRKCIWGILLPAHDCSHLSNLSDMNLCHCLRDYFRCFLKFFSILYVAFIFSISTSLPAVLFRTDRISEGKTWNLLCVGETAE